MKKSAICLFAFLICICTYAQTPSIQWQKCLGGSMSEQGKSIIQTRDGGFAITGYTLSNDGDVSGNHGGLDMWVAKTDDLGNIVWKKCLGGTYDDQGNSIIQTTDGGFLIAGYTYSNDGDVSGLHLYSGPDAWLVKLDSNGNLLWQKCLGGSGGEIANSIIETDDGGFILTGSASSNDGDLLGNKIYQGSDIWIVKLDYSWNIQWQRCVGGNSQESGNSIIQCSDKGYAIVGQTTSNDGDIKNFHGLVDMYVLKLDLFGNIQWQGCLGGTNTDIAYSIVQAADGGYVVAGQTNSKNGDVNGLHSSYPDAWVVKLDSFGVKIWQRCLGGKFDEVANCIKLTFDNGYIIAGHTNSNDGDVSGNHGAQDFWIVKLNLEGVIQWQKCLGGGYYESAYSIVQTENGDYALGGYASSNDGDVIGLHNYPGNDMWIVKLSNLSSINFYNTSNSLKNKILLDSTILPNYDINPIKICADGSKATFIEYYNNDPNIQISNIRFKIFEDITGLQKDEYGFFDSIIISNDNPNKLTVYYNHPTYMNQSSVYRNLTINIYDNSTGNLIYAYPIQIYRAPLLMVHGLMGHASSFAEFEKKLLNGNALYPGNIMTSPLTYRLDYSPTNMSSFETNKDVVKRGIDFLLNQAVNTFGYSAGKVDVVAHSMGGIAARLYIQNPYGSVPFRSDIHKLITFNTPHSGTQLAAWGTQTFCPAFSIGLLFITRGASLLICPAFNNAFPAFGDLSCNSDATDKFLNGKSIANTRLVPTMALTSTTELSFDDPDCSFVEESLAPNPLLDLFKGEANDGVVPLSSQQGGVFPILSATPNVCHIGSVNDSQLINKAIQLINGIPNSSNFDVNGYIPPDITYYSTQPKINNPTATNAVNFIAPADHSNFRPGQTFKVKASGTTEVKSMQLLIGNEIFSSVGIDTIGRSLVYNYTIPPSAAGEMRMIVFGFDSLQQYVFDTVRIYIVPTAILDSINIYPKTISVPENLKTSFEITGYYHDGYARNISSIPNIIYKINDTSIATHTILNEIQGKKQDTTSITVSYLGKNKSVPVQVLNGSDYLHAGFASYDTLVCRGQQVHFTNYSTGTPDSIKWILTGATPSTSKEQNPSVVYNKTGVYDAKLICYYPQKNDTLLLPRYLRVINIVPARPGTIMISKGTNKTCPGDTILYSINPVVNATSYLWKVPVGASILSGQGTTSIKVFYSSAFTKNDSVSVLAANGCGTGPIRYSKIVLRCNQIVSTYAQTSIISKDATLVVFPNPFNNTLYLNGDLISAKKCQVIVTDILGRRFFSKVFYGNNYQIEINTQMLQKGFYFLIIQTDNKREVLKVEKL